MNRVTILAVAFAIVIQTLSPYKVLQLAEKATEVEVNEKFRELTKAYKGDREVTNIIKKAYN